MLLAKKLIAASDEGCHLRVGHGAGEHPEATVRMHPLDTLGTEHLDSGPRPPAALSHETQASRRRRAQS